MLMKNKGAAPRCCRLITFIRYIYTKILLKVQLMARTMLEIIFRVDVQEEVLNIDV